MDIPKRTEPPGSLTCLQFPSQQFKSFQVLTSSPSLSPYLLLSLSLSPFNLLSSLLLFRRLAAVAVNSRMILDDDYVDGS